MFLVALAMWQGALSLAKSIPPVCMNGWDENWSNHLILTLLSVQIALDMY